MNGQASYIRTYVDGSHHIGRSEEEEDEEDCLFGHNIAYGQQDCLYQAHTLGACACSTCAVEWLVRVLSRQSCLFVASAWGQTVHMAHERGAYGLSADVWVFRRTPFTFV